MHNHIKANIKSAKKLNGTVPFNDDSSKNEQTRRKMILGLLPSTVTFGDVLHK